MLRVRIGVRDTVRVIVRVYGIGWVNAFKVRVGVRDRDRVRDRVRVRVMIRVRVRVRDKDRDRVGVCLQAQIFEGASFVVKGAMA